MKRQRSLFSFGFGQESGSSTPPEKRPAVDSERSEGASGEAQSLTESQSTSPAESPNRSESQTGPTQSLSISTEPVSPVSSFENLSPPYDISEVYDMVNRLSNYERYKLRLACNY